MITTGLEPSTLLSLDGIHKSYGDFVALDTIDLNIRPGEFLTILGPSGCGKSTMLRLIGGFEQPSSGFILLSGKPIQDTPPESRPFNTVFQSYALFPHMTVWDNVAYGLRVAGVSRGDVARRVDDVLELVHMSSFADRRPPTMSGGQRQRVALARALVNEPEILLLDEPLGALDLKLRHTLQAELRAIQHRLGITFVFVTHDQEEAMSLSDRICVMRRGAIEQLGTPRDLYLRPESAYVADFIGHANLVPCQIICPDGESWRLSFGSGMQHTLPSFASQPATAGEDALAVLRPEDLELVSREDPSAMFAGMLVDEVFLGADAHFTVEITDGYRMDVRGRQSDLSAFRGEVGVRIRPDSGVVVPADTEIAPATLPSRLFSEEVDMASLEMGIAG